MRKAAILLILTWLLAPVAAFAQAANSSQTPQAAQPVQADPCSYAVKSSASINISSATTTQLVAISGSTAIYVCGFTVTINQIITTANTIQFEYGTSTNCTGVNKLTGLFGAGGITAGLPIAVTYGYGTGTIFTAPASNGLCALTAGTTPNIQGVLTYVQQ